MSGSPFHVGEQRVQARLGVREDIESFARRVVRPYLPEQHREFYSQLPFVVAAARDGRGRPWATILAGAPGFIESLDETGLHLRTRVLPGDALADSLTAGAELGLLGIELDTRRRNRVNGTITEIGAGGIRFAVGQSFGNCPQYITERSWFEVDVDESTGRASRHRRLDAAMQAWISAADTFFIASGYAGDGGESETFGMDASHRGGAPGFVQVVDDGRLVFPDYAGNNHFNTIGNLTMDPRVGLLFVDFEGGSVLQITGKATVDFDSAEVKRYPGAQRLVVIDIEEIVRLDGVLPLRWSEPAGSVRSLRVARKVRESDDVVSLHLIARDGGTLPDFEAGQHLPIELRVEGEARPVKRTYSLSNGPGEGHYRISVKREPHGLVSRLLHDALEEDDIIAARAPAGEFVLGYSRRPVALVSAGIGVTPMLSMLHRLVADGGRRVVFAHGARDGAHHPLAEEVRELATVDPEVRLHVAFSRPRGEDVPGRDYDREGRLDAGIIVDLLGAVDADVFLCGPVGFMADMSRAIEARGIDSSRIHTETFGPSA